jgi:hypothetical protein
LFRQTFHSVVVTELTTVGKGELEQSQPIEPQMFVI